MAGGIAKIGCKWVDGNQVFYDLLTGEYVQVHKQTTSVASDQVGIYVSKSGNDTTGLGTINSPFLTVTKALTLATATRKNIHVGPGVYQEANELTWPTVSGIKLLGAGPPWLTEIELASGHGDDQVINVAPGAVASTFELTIAGIRINHDESGLDGILLNNTSMTKKLNCYLVAVGGDADSDSDSFLTWTHTDTDNAIRVYWGGPRNGEVDGNIAMNVGNAGDRLYVKDADLMGGIVVGAGAIAATLRLRDCVVKHEGVTGGNAATLVTTMSSFSLTGTTFAALDGDDIAGSITGELILP